MEVGEASAAADEIRWRAVLHNAAVMDHQYPVGSLHGGEPVRDDQRRPAGLPRRPGRTCLAPRSAGVGRSPQEPRQAVLDQPLGRDVQRGRGLIQDQHRGPGQEGARES